MKRYDNIQILRVLACLGVFVSHLAPKMGAVGSVAKAANFGASGVYLFFLVSAFLACATGKSSVSGGSWRELLRYYAKRALRILPLYYAVILYNFLLHSFILKDVSVDPAGLGWLRYIFLTNAFIPAPDNFWANLTATWTISLFWVFYLCAPFFTKLAGVKPERGKIQGGGNVDFGKITDVGKIASEKGGYGGILRAALLYIGFVLLQQIWSGLECSDYMMCFYYMNFFVLGILVWQLASCPKKGAAAAILAGICAVLGAGFLLWKGEVPYFTGISWIYAFVVLLTMNFSWERAVSWPGIGKGMRILQKVFAVLDKHSYAIYLIHAVVIDGMVLVMAHVSLSGLAVGIISVLLTVFGVGAAYLVIEKPIAGLSRKL